MSSSCFKIISCGGRDAVNDGDLETSPQGKSAGDKRGWSFRKRSARHRVLSNTVISETPPTGNKGSPESAAVVIPRPPGSTIPEKTSSVQWADGKPQSPLPVNLKPSETTAGEADNSKVDAKPVNLKLPENIAGEADDSNIDVTPVNLKLTETITGEADDGDVVAIPVNSKFSETIAAEADHTKNNSSLDESVAIIIQTGIRSFLAQKVLLKHKNVVKLQAAVRGHFVRRQAVGTLRCVQAIVEMQSLVRARRSRAIQEYESTATMKGKSSSKPHVTYTSIEKLLCNKFAQQLLESTPKTKAINIKCDPSKSDSAWKWLERWNSVASTENGPLVDTKPQEQEKVELVDSQAETVVSSESNRESADMKPPTKTSESNENLITDDADRLDVQVFRPTSPSTSYNLDKPVPHNTSEISSIKPDSFLERNEFDVPKVEPYNLSTGTDAEGDQVLKRTALDQPETEEKKLPFGSEKTSNPAFLAARSKFEELSTVTKSLSSTNQDGEAESCTSTVPSFSDHSSRERKSGLVGNLLSDSTKLQSVDSDSIKVQYSECGTELSISSTLDTPDGSEVGANEFEQEDRNIAHESEGNFELEAKGESTNLDSDLPHANVAVVEQHTSFNDDDLRVSVHIQQVEKKPDADEIQMQAETENGHPDRSSPETSPRIHVNASEAHLSSSNMDVFELQTVAETEKGRDVFKSSPETSPGIHKIISETQGTPSSEASVKPKKTRDNKSGSKSNPKHKSSSAGKRVHSNLNHDSGARSSTEQLPKDHKMAKRRNTIGSPKPDHVDQEPRDSTSSNSLPSYMQPTESARAKALLINSPRSSPDMQEKEVHMKKRHSLPGANGRHGSPQIQRTKSEARQAAKGNGSQSPQERKWRR